MSFCGNVEKVISMTFTFFENKLKIDIHIWQTAWKEGFWKLLVAFYINLHFIKK